DLQFPRLYLHLRTQQPWAVPREEDHTARSHAGNAQGDQGGAATADASANPRARGVDRAGGQRLFRLPRSANERGCAENILLLRRRSQKDRFSWQRMHRLAAHWIPQPRILHPYPDQRFAVTHPRWEPCAGIPPARILAGGGP